MHRLLASILALAAAGCGAKSTLDVPPPRADGGQPTDAGVDGGPPGELMVECGPSPQYTTPRRAITLQAMVSGSDPLARQGWTLTSSPPASMTATSSWDGPLAVLTPDVPGAFRMRFTAQDTRGRSASCEVEVQAIVGPPVAICPAEELHTPAGVPLRIEGAGFDDEGVVSFRWEIVSAPPGAMATIDGAETSIVVLRSFTRGRHQLRLTVTDSDMETDSCEFTVLVSGPPEVVCPRATIDAPTRRPLTIEARVTDDVGLASRRWEMLARPPGSTAAPMPPDRDVTTLTPDREGRYHLRFTATDVEGLSGSCEVTVNATPTPPEVTCPALLETVPLTPVGITASAVDDGRIVGWSWDVTGRPPGSAAPPPSPDDRPATRFTPDLAGVYEVEVTATDDDGMTGSCTTEVRAGNVDGLRIEMSWSTEGSDIDLHLLNPTGTRWVGPDDCYYANCNVTHGRNLEWGAPGDQDNPRLDLDNTSGRGPENINIARPQPGTYRVGIHAYRGGDGPHRVTVRVYCGGSTTTPRQTFGPVTLRTPGGPGRNDFWRVADVTISGAGCSIADLSRASGPWIERHDSTTDMR